MAFAVAPSDVAYGPWNPGIRSQVPRELLHMATIFREENVFTRVADAEEWRDLSGFELADLAAFRPQRLALHELLVRVTANFSVPDGSRIEDLGINFRRISTTLLERCVTPAMPSIIAAFEATRSRTQAFVDAELARLFDREVAPAASPRRRWFGFLRRTPPSPPASPESDAEREQRIVGEWEHRAATSNDAFEKAAYHALSRVVSALRIRHGHAWGGRELVASLVTSQTCNDFGSTEIGRLLDPLLARAADAEG